MQLLLSELLTATVSLASGALTPGVNFFANTMPASPAICTVLVLNGGVSDPLIPLRNPGFQILHRGTSPTSMISLATSIHAGFRRAWGTLPTIRARIIGSGELSSPVYDRTTSYFYVSSNYVLTAVTLN